MRKKIAPKKKSVSKHPARCEEKVFRLISEYKKRFGLRGYGFSVKFVRGAEVSDYYAEILIKGRQARLFMNADLMDSDPKSITDTVVHEMLHVLFYHLMNSTGTIVERYVRRATARRKLERKLENLEHDIIERLVPAVLGGRARLRGFSERMHNGNRR